MELSHKTAPNRQVFIYFDIWNPDDFFFGGGHQAIGADRLRLLPRFVRRLSAIRANSLRQSV